MNLAYQPHCVEFCMVSQQPDCTPLSVTFDVSFHEPLCNQLSRTTYIYVNEIKLRAEDMYPIPVCPSKSYYKII